MATRPSNLIYVDDSLPGITRKGAGKGWAYYDPDGKLIRDRCGEEAPERHRLSSRLSRCVVLPGAQRPYPGHGL